MQAAVEAAGGGLTYGMANPKVFLRAVSVFEEMDQLIEQAQHEVLIQSYAYESSFATETLMTALQRLQARREKDAPNEPPVRVTILMDQEAHHLPFQPNNIGPLKRDLAALKLDPRYVQVDVRPYAHWLLGVLHSKDVIVDGKVALVTGFNFQKNGDTDVNWYDSGYELEGGIVTALRQEYANAAAHLGLAIGPPPEARKGPLGAVPMLLIGRPAVENWVAKDTDNSQDRVFVALFNHAQRSIRAVSPNLSAPPVIQALVNACRRGVRVELLLSKGFNQAKTELPFGGGPNDEAVAKLEDEVRALGKSQQLDVRWESDDGLTPTVGNGLGAAHAKFTSVDGQVAVVGSTNLDVQSWYHSREIDAVIDDAAVTKAWDEQVFRPRFEQGLGVDSAAGKLGSNEPKSLKWRLERAVFGAVQGAAWAVSSWL
jgi:phosphatidylserine/phosphatidylglycerophosphate/cardiolipin synthase-like enzyme